MEGEWPKLITGEKDRFAYLASKLIDLSLKRTKDMKEEVMWGKITLKNTAEGTEIVEENEKKVPKVIVNFNHFIGNPNSEDIELEDEDQHYLHVQVTDNGP